MPTKTRSRRSTPQRRPAQRSRSSSARRTGLSAKTYSGLSTKRMKQKSGGGSSNALNMKGGNTYPSQFLQTPKEFKEFDQHQWKEDGRWWYVPCAGDDCPMCEDEDGDKSKKHYRFVANIYSLKDRKVLVLEGPKTLATQIFYKYKRKPGVFLKRVYDITKYPTSPVTYNVELAEEAPVRTSGLKLLDLDEYIDEALQRYIGEDGASKSSSRKKKRSALDDEDFEDEDEFEDEEDDDYEDDDEEDDEDEDDDDEEDDEDEDEEPEEDEMMDKDAWGWSELKEYGREVGLRKDYKKRSLLVAAIVKKRGY